MIQNEWMRKIDLLARQKLQQPPTFETFRYEAMDDGGLIVTGAVPIGYRTRGKRKGEPYFPNLSHCKRCVLTAVELNPPPKIPGNIGQI